MSKKTEIARIGRHRRIRKNLVGTPEHPRLCVHRSLTNLYVQIVDDIAGKILISTSTLDKEFKQQIKYGGNIKAASMLGEILAKKAKAKGINKVIFDRGGYLYHGRVKALAEAARKAGLEF